MGEERDKGPEIGTYNTTLLSPLSRYTLLHRSFSEDQRTQTFPKENQESNPMKSKQEDLGDSFHVSLLFNSGSSLGLMNLLETLCTFSWGHN